MPDASRAFVYGLIDPETRAVFYVGQSTRGMQRPRDHARKGWTFEIAILETVLDPRAPTPSLCPWLPEGRNQTALHEAERWWIAYGRASGWPLRNKTDGGEGTRGVNRSPEQRARYADATRRQFADPEARARFCEAQRNKPPMSIEARAKVSAAGRGRRDSDAARANKSAAQRRRAEDPVVRARLLAMVHDRGPPGPEARVRMSAAAKARSPADRARIYEKTRNPSPETLAKMSAASRSRSPETIEKIRAATKAQWERRRAGQLDRGSPDAA